MQEIKGITKSSDYPNTEFWSRGRSRAAATKMDSFLIAVNGFQLFITKHSILDVSAVLDPPLVSSFKNTNNTAR